jgi:hypothetical protein
MTARETVAKQRAREIVKTLDVSIGDLLLAIGDEIIELYDEESGPAAACHLVAAAAILDKANAETIVEILGTAAHGRLQ